MPFFTTPTSFRQANAFAALQPRDLIASPSNMTFSSLESMQAPQSSHPAFGHLILLVFEAVLEVVCVSAPGYIIARMGMFDAENQKFIANLNVMLFTPCLIFTKLASQLTADKLAELAVIPFIFVVQTLVSYLCSIGISKVFGFGKRPRNFVIAMGVFGNSNSLPISLVLSLSKTISGLHWDKIPGDNDEEVGARGILYLLIFQQLGQLVRWSWGYHVLLAPRHKFADDSEPNHQIEQGQGGYRDNPEEEHVDDLLVNVDGQDDTLTQRNDEHKAFTNGDSKKVHSTLHGDSDYASGEQTPETGYSHESSSSSGGSLHGGHLDGERGSDVFDTPTNGVLHRNHPSSQITSFPSIRSPPPSNDDIPSGVQGWFRRLERSVKSYLDSVATYTSTCSKKVYTSLPQPFQKMLSTLGSWLGRFLHGVWEFMNPPLWAMLVAVIIASVPDLQRLFFSEGTFVRNSITRAISQSGGVAVPLILVVLGANLARNTLPEDPHATIDHDKHETKLLIASLVSRMLLPTVVMAPLLALAAKYIPVSILDDPIFVVVCFLLTGAPSALQLAQICQINGVYEGVMSKLLFQSYVIWILPSTLVLVMCALEVVDWAA